MSGTGVLAKITYVSNASTPNNTVVNFTLSDVTVNKSDGSSIALSAVSGSTTITSGILVWPGDTNNSGNVDQADILPLGLYLNTTGPKRPNRSTFWSAQPCPEWFPAAVAFADANGDGVVNLADVLVIGLNWGKTGALSEDFVSEISAGGTILPTTQTKLPLSAGAEFFVDVNAKDATNLFGVSFVLTYDGKDLIEPVSAEIGTFLGNDVIFFPQVEVQADKISVGISKKSGQSNVSGSGTIVRVKLKASKSIVQGTKITFTLTDIAANNSSGASLNITPQAGYWQDQIVIPSDIILVSEIGKSRKRINSDSFPVLKEKGLNELTIEIPDGAIGTLSDTQSSQLGQYFVSNKKRMELIKISASDLIRILNSKDIILNINIPNSIPKIFLPFNAIELNIEGINNFRFSKPISLSIPYSFSAQSGPIVTEDGKKLTIKQLKIDTFLENSNSDNYIHRLSSSGYIHRWDSIKSMAAPNFYSKAVAGENVVAGEIDTTGIFGVLYEQNPPIITTTELNKARVGVPYSDTVFVIELDIDQTSTLQYTIEKGPEWLKINNTTGELSGTPLNEKESFYDNQVIISVADSTGLSASLDTVIDNADVVEVLDKPKRFFLNSPFPNPFNSSTTISYEIPENSIVVLCIYDILGNKIKELHHGLQRAGFYKVTWDGRDNRNNFVSTGIYLFEIKTERNHLCKKVLLLR